MSTTTDEPSQSLDALVEQATGCLLEVGASHPAALVMAGVGRGLLPERLTDATELTLPSDPVFGPWSACSVVQGSLGGLRIWILDDSGLDAPLERQAPWLHALPVWVAANLGARLLIHTSAGAYLEYDEELAPGDLLIATDHINLSGRTPLLGLGESRYGPLFPDQTRLHDPAVRAVLNRAADERGIGLATGVVACTTGPAVETPAEQAWFAGAGARVSVQGLSSPLIAAAHAGLGVSALVAVVQRRGEAADLRRILQNAERSAPAIEDLLLTAAPGLAALLDEDDLPTLPRAHD